jgi:hypothetical protein
MEQVTLLQEGSWQAWSGTWDSQGQSKKEFTWLLYLYAIKDANLTVKSRKMITRLYQKKKNSLMTFILTPYPKLNK